MLKDVSFEIVYSTGEHEPIDFFFEALLESKTFDLGLGFFCSSGINVLYAGFAYFISNGGKMRVIINDLLSLKDKESILEGTIRPESQYEDILINNFQSLFKTLSKQDEHFFRCLSCLVSKRQIEFVATVPLNKGGIAHNKFGIFSDGLNKIAFNGSANFSKTALLENIESISCYKSWSGERNELERLQYFENLFNKTWQGCSDYVHIIPLERVKTLIQEHFPENDISDLLNNEVKLIPKRFLTTQKYIETLKVQSGEMRKEPSFPFVEGPRNYQITAYTNWRKNEYKGIFAMATGTGKTITSINCVLQEYNIHSFYKVLILVPTIALLEQWYHEIKKFGFLNVFTTANRNWIQIFDNISLVGT